MVTSKMKIKSESAQAAKEIKAILKAKYPTTKFSVKSENFAGGNSVDVKWIFGPTYNEVENIVKRRQYGYFDSMDDMYIHTSHALDVLPNGEVKEVACAKYVQCSRQTAHTLTDYKYRADVLNIFAKIGKDHGWQIQANGDWQPEQWGGVDQTASNVYYRFTQKIAFRSDNVELLDLIWIDRIHDYRLIYKDLNTGKIIAGIN